MLGIYKSIKLRNSTIQKSISDGKLSMDANHDTLTINSFAL